MKKKLQRRILSDRNKVFTPESETTVYINYSYSLQKLEIKFRGNRVYQYKNVDPSVWGEYKSTIESGGSSGGFVNQKIKPFYEVEELDEGQ